jgi:hypothetical protein
MLDKTQVQAVFTRVSRALTGIDYAQNPQKQLIQIKNDVTIGDQSYTLDWDVFVSENELSHKDLLDWLAGHDGWDADATKLGNVMVAYLIGTVSTSLSKRLALNIGVIEAMLEELDLTFAELVEKVGVSHTASRQIPDGCLNQEFYDALKGATAQLLEVQGYESHRNIFAKTAAKAGKKVGKLKIK